MIFNGSSHEHSLKMWLQWQQRIGFQNLTYTRNKSQVSGKNLLPLQRYLSKLISEGETPSGPHRVKADRDKLILAKQKCRTAFLGLNKCLINCIFYRVAAKKHS